MQLRCIDHLRQRRLFIWHVISFEEAEERFVAT